MTAMSLLTRLIAYFNELPPIKSRDVQIDRDIKIPMPDGVILLANRHYPRDDPSAPTILVRSPYGRVGFFGILYASLYAERGFQVLIQSTRGTFGSGGKLDPFNEQMDGLATIDWIKKQSWFTGKLFTNGASYLGIVQFAVAKQAGDDIQAMAIQVSTSEFREQTYAGGAFSLDAGLSWTTMMMSQEKSLAMMRNAMNSRKVKSLFSKLPLNELDKLATGQTVDFYQAWLEHNKPNDAYWQKRDYREDVKDIKTPIFMTTGWYDIFLPWTMRDYRALRDAGQSPYLTIGPWEHSELSMHVGALNEIIPYFNAHLSGDFSQIRKNKVRLYVSGADEWREYPDFPLADTQMQEWYLQADKGLATTLPADSPADTYRYDPNNPTPSVAGPLLTGAAKPVDNTELEGRSDVLTYTSAPLPENLEIIGTVQVELIVKSSLQYTDFFARLCDVDESGRSINVCDMLYRLRPGEVETKPDGTSCIHLDLWQTAHRFNKGHRLRLQISSGAHPRFARNTGTEEIATTTQMIPADQSIFHDPQHLSKVILPVVGA